jgi:hypothetical protein
MNVYLDFDRSSNGIERVVTQLSKYLPDGHKEVHSIDEADFIVIHVFGRHDHMIRLSRQLIESGKQYAVIQYVLRSSRNPKAEEWLDLWNPAKVVWSYYGEVFSLHNGYLAPLAADPEIFYKVDVNPEGKSHLINMISADYVSECQGEVRLAAWLARGRVYHVGKKFGEDPNVDHFDQVDDEKIRLIYNDSLFTSALRRKDGFELVAVESLLCGTRPIVFDTPDYRRWFDKLAIFIPETSPGRLCKNLEYTLNVDPIPVTDEEIEETKRRFNWKNIIEGFWQRCLN